MKAFCLLVTLCLLTAATVETHKKDDDKPSHHHDDDDDTNGNPPCPPEHPICDLKDVGKPLCCTAASGLIVNLGVMADVVLSGLLCTPLSLWPPLNIEIPDLISLQLNASCLDLRAELQVAVDAALSLLEGQCDNVGSGNCSCPAGYHPHEGKCYKHVHTRDPISWDEAKAYCAQNGAQLLTVHKQPGGGILTGLLRFLGTLLGGKKNILGLWINLDLDVDVNVKRSAGCHRPCEDDEEEEEDCHPSHPDDCDEEDVNRRCPVLRPNGKVEWVRCNGGVHDFICVKETEECGIVGIVKGLIAEIKRILLLALQIVKNVLALLSPTIAALVEKVVCLVIELLFAALDAVLAKLGLICGCP